MSTYIIAISLITGVAFGIILTLSILRRLGKMSQHSAVALELFYKFTKYKARLYNIERTPHNITVKVCGNDNNDDNNNLVDILNKQMGFPLDRVRAAIKHATKVAPDKSLEEKLREALKYLDDENNYKTITKEA